MYKLSIIMPVYNQEQLVIRALDSIPKNNLIEVIIIDDCSTDKTNELITNWKNKQHISVTILKNEANMGVGYTVNRGLDVAKGEYIVRLDSDDYFLTQNVMPVLKYAKGEDLIYFNLRINSGHIMFLDKSNKEKYCGTTKLMKRSFIGDTRFPEMKAEEDWFFYQELLKKNPTEVFTKILMTHYNWPREGSLCYLKSRGELDGFDYSRML